MLEKTLESPLDCKEIQPVHSEGDQSWVFYGRNDAKAETPVLWPPHVKSWLIGKDSDAGRDWRQEEKGMTEDEMAGWHPWLDGRESKWTPGVGDGQGGLECCSSWGQTRLSDWNELNWMTLLQKSLSNSIALNRIFIITAFVSKDTSICLLFKVFCFQQSLFYFTNIQIFETFIAKSFSTLCWF